ncbi:MAG: hypothetical protein JSS81_17645 [Acidobacteria bacterium]|nr:hypothetical protein [Acidobacteriota bacterium]
MIFGHHNQPPKRFGFDERFVAAVLSLFVVVMLLNAWATGWKPGLGPVTEGLPENLQADHLCRELPKPEKFEFVSSETVENLPKTKTVRYRYRTDRANEEVMPTFLVWFDANKWRRAADIKLGFRRDARTIFFKSDDDFASDYQIYCRETGEPPIIIVRDK